MEEHLERRKRPVNSRTVIVVQLVEVPVDVFPTIVTQATFASKPELSRIFLFWDL
jgi:hypothetical protein